MSGLIRWTKSEVGFYVGSGVARASLILFPPNDMMDRAGWHWECHFAERVARGEVASEQGAKRAALAAYRNYLLATIAEMTQELEELEGQIA